MLEIRLRTKNFEKVRETVQSYDIDNLIGEIGGTFSMFLGFCGMNIILYMARIKIILHGVNLNLKPFTVIAMTLPFTYWSTQAVLNYMDEPVSTQSSMNSKIDIKSEFPQLTFCVNLPYLEDALRTATLDQTKYDNFHAALEAALKNDINLDLHYVNISAFHDHPFHDVHIMLQGAVFYNYLLKTKHNRKYLIDWDFLLF